MGLTRREGENTDLLNEFDGAPGSVVESVTVDEKMVDVLRLEAEDDKNRRRCRPSRYLLSNKTQRRD